jgi:hypothetical protein
MIPATQNHLGSSARRMKVPLFSRVGEATDSSGNPEAGFPVITLFEGQITMNTSVTRGILSSCSLLVLTLPLLQACESGGAWEGTVTDSAGIAIVANTATPLWRGDEAWTVEEELSIGTVAGEPEYQFGLISGIDVDGEGNIHVLDLQAREVRSYDSQGNYLRTFGGPGSGPGELSQQALGLFATPSGEILVIDLGNQRVNRYASDGTSRGSFRVDISSGVPARWDIAADGRVMAQLRGLNLPGMAALAEGDPIVIYDTTGVVVDTLTMLPKGQTVEELSEERISMRLFAPEPLWDLADDGTVYTAMSNRYRIQMSTPDGALTRIITRDVERKLVSEGEQTAILEALREQMSGLGAPPQAVEQIIQGVVFADHYPVFGLLFCGPGQSLWVQRIRSAADMVEGEDVEFDPQAIGSPEWEVFDAEGRYLGVVTLPERFQPAAVDGDFLYGIWRDELDVQHVKRLRVNMPTG